jgi:hypothetical protein
VAGADAFSNSRFDETTPVYVHVFPTVNDAFPPGSITIQYWLFYPFNGPVQHSVAAGAHEGDWEHVSVVVHNVTHDVLGVYMAAHDHSAFWLSRHNVTFAGSHVHVFVSMFTHAAYETPGQHVRARARDLGPITDYCDVSGAAWFPHNVVNVGERYFPMKEAPWLLFNGYWGSRRLQYSAAPLQLDTGMPPLGPAHQTDYWNLY